MHQLAPAALALWPGRRRAFPRHAQPEGALGRYPSMPSTAIRAALYRPDERVLDLTFVTGRRYRYFDVPAEVAEGFARARSKGAWFNRRIRDRFDFAEIAGEDDGAR